MRATFQNLNHRSTIIYRFLNYIIIIGTKPYHLSSAQIDPKRKEGRKMSVDLASNSHGNLDEQCKPLNEPEVPIFQLVIFISL